MSMLPLGVVCMCAAARLLKIVNSMCNAMEFDSLSFPLQHGQKRETLGNAQAKVGAAIHSDKLQDKGAHFICRHQQRR